MDIKIINLYCDTVIKPLEMRKKELEHEIYRHRFFTSRSKKEELRLVKQLLSEKFKYLANLTDELEKEL